MNRNVIETVLGAVVLLTAAVFLSFAYSSADLGKKEGYNVRADFDRIDGLKAGGDVRMNGVQVGSILNIALDKENFRATVNFSLDKKIKLPRDTIAMIASESLLGGKYLSLEVGVEDENIATDDTGRLTRTTPPMRLDDLIGHMIFKEDDKKKNQQQPANGNSSSATPLNNMPLLATEPAPAGQ
ncbi:MAG: outer membrane lipid asymmetry maintenance protein MlaD [Alphaproteobacteria bacterium]|nr:outer membrane lipid asymmetry maintenance protein MlaD [Alphaproteobacteria bacterium]